MNGTQVSGNVEIAVGGGGYQIVGAGAPAGGAAPAFGFAAMSSPAVATGIAAGALPISASGRGSVLLPGSLPPPAGDPARPALGVFG